MKYIFTFFRFSCILKYWEEMKGMKKLCYNIIQRYAGCGMPTVFREDGYRFFFFSDEHLPEHIHVEKGDGYMRVELKSLQVTHRYKVS